jgi:hypothetical protein
MATMAENKRQSIIGIGILKTGVHKNAHFCNTIQRELTEVTARLEQLKRDHDEWTRHNPHALVHSVFVLLGVTAVYFLDLLLFAPTAEVLSNKAFHDYPFMSVVARVLVPLAILLFEIFIALHIFTTKRDRDMYHAQHPAVLWLWIMIGILVSCVMPFLVIGTSLVQLSYASEDARRGISWQMGGLAILSLVLHVGIIFSGRISNEAKAYFAFKIKHRSMERQNRNYNRLYDKNLESLRQSFDLFYQQINRHRMEFLDNHDPGPFDVITKNLLNKLYGYEIIQTPEACNGGNNASVSNSGGPGGGSPNNSGPGGTDPDDDHLGGGDSPEAGRAKVRDAEREVRV